MFKPLPSLAILALCALPLAAEKLEILAALPSGELDTQEWSREVKIVFNQPMVALQQVARDLAIDAVAAQPPLPGTWRWAGGDTLILRVTNRLAWATSYAVEVGTGIASLSGERLAQPYRFTFNTPRPRLVEQDPSPNAVDTPLSQNVVLAFDQEVQAKGSSAYLDLFATGNKQLGYRWSEGRINDEVYGMSPELKARMVEWRDRVADRKRSRVVFRVSYGHSNEREIQEWKTGRLAGAVKPAIGAIDRRVLVLEPLEPLPRSSKIQVIVSEGLKGLEGNLGAKGRRFEFNTFHEFFVQDAPVKAVNPFNPGALQFTTAVSPEALRPYLFLNEYDPQNPTVKVRTLPWPKKDGGHSTGNQFWLSSWQLEPLTPYELVVVKGLTNVWGDVLPETFTHRFTTANAPAYVDLPTGTLLLEAYFPRKLPLAVCNVKTLVVGRRALSGDEVGAFAGYPMAKLPAGDFKLVELPAKQNKPLATDLELPGEAGEDVVVAYQVTPRDFYTDSFADKKPSTWSGLVQFTSLAIGAKAGGHETLVYVTDISNNKPIAAAQVSAYQKSGRLAWKGRTDERGFARAPGREQLGSGDWWIWVESGKRRGFVHADFSQDLDSWGFNIPREYQENPDRALGYLLTDRGVYRQGETVYVKGILRRITNECFALPEGSLATVTVRDRNGGEVFTNRVRLSEFGSFDFSFDLPKDLPLGTCSVRAVWDGESAGCEFLATQFRAPLFRNLVAAGGGLRFLGDRERFTVKGQWLFGAPIPGAQVNWFLTSEETAFAPPLPGEKAEAWSFADEIESADPRARGHRRASEARQSGQGLLSAEGLFTAELALGPAPGAAPRLWNFEAEIQTPDKQTVAARASRLVHPASAYAALKRAKYFVDSTAPLSFQAGAVTPEGRWAPGLKMELRLYRRSWKTALRRGMADAWRNENTLVDEEVWRSDVASTGGPLALGAKLTQSGYHILRARLKDAAGRESAAAFDFYALGGGASPWWFADGDRIEITPEQDRAKPGDVVRVLVKSPWERCRALVTLERGKVLEQFWRDFEGYMPTFEVPIRFEHAPNIIVGVLLMKGRETFEVTEDHLDKGVPVVKLGYAAISVVPDAARLTAELTPARALYEPGETVELGVRVKAASGAGVRSEVTLFAVDEAIVNLTGYRPPDPLAFFYEPRGLNVNTVDNRPYVLKQRLFGSKGDEAGGGGGEDQGMGGAVRSDFRVTPFWTGSLVTGADGGARASFKLPDNLTTFKIFAVAADAARFGSGDSQVTVRKDFMLTPSFPRFATRGDRFAAAVQAHNLTGEAGSVTLSVAPPAGVAVDAPTLSFRLPAGSSTNLRIPMRAVGLGEARFTVRGEFKTAAAVKRDAFEHRLPLLQPAVSESAVVCGALRERSDQRREQILLPTNAYPDAGGLSLQTASSLMQDLKVSLDYLQGYPHGCVEQTASRLWAAGVRYRLQEDFKLEGDRVDLPLLSSILAHLYKFQTEDGGLSYWPGLERSNPWGTAWALLALKGLARQEIPLRESFVKKALDYLAQEAKKPGDSQWWGWTFSASSRAFMLLALAQWDRFEPSVVDSLEPRLDDLSILSRAQLLEVLALQKAKLGRTSEGFMAKLKQSVMNSAVIEGAQVSFRERPFENWEYLFYTDNRTTGGVLSALVAAEPRSPLLPKIVAFLQQARKNGRWLNTQENAFCVRGLFDYYRVVEKDAPSFTATVAMKGETLSQTRWTERTMRVERQEFPMADLAARLSPGVPADLVFAKEGPGVLYYTARLSYAPLPGAKPALAGFRLERKYFHNEGPKAGQSDTVFRAGETVKVVLTLSTPSPRQFVALVDPLPAGFEILDDRLQTSTRALMQEATPAQEEGWHWFPTGWTYREAHDHQQTAYADRLLQGERAFVYVVRATTPGVFAAAAGKVECMYFPEIFATTGSDQITVKE
ncbi:MAG: Ig-like domain-containing protein [Spirochaetes bacterium]|nr:Ig-like domain-containing protein [Spirochaetota bacterium]